MISQEKKAHLSILTATFIFGLNYSVAKSLVPDTTSPLQLVFLRLAGSILVLFAILSIHGSFRIRKKHFIRFIGAAVSGVVINQVFFFEGIARTSPVESAIIHTASPVMVLTFASFALKEKYTSLNWAGVVLGLTGTLLLVLFQKGGLSQETHTLGNILIIINMTAYSAYMVIVKPLMRYYSAITVMFWVFLLGLLLTLPFSAREIADFPLSFPKITVLGSLVYVIFLSTLAGFTLTVYGLRHLKAGTAAYYMYLQPLIAGISGFLAGHQNFGWPMAVSGCLIFTGVYLVNRK